MLDKFGLVCHIGYLIALDICLVVCAVVIAAIAVAIAGGCLWVVYIIWHPLLSLL